MNATRALQLTSSFIRKDGGGSVVFSRIADASTSPPTRIFAPCPYAFWRAYRPNELGGGVEQGDSLMVIEGGSLGALIQGLGTPPRMNDKVLVNGFERNVQQAGDAIIVNGVPVRINLTIRG